jgi:hypothetical protein
VVGTFDLYRDPDSGMWTFIQQVDQTLVDRTGATFEAHAEALMNMSMPRRPT